MIADVHVLSLIAQAPEWVDGLIFLAIVVLSAIGSLGKWIVGKIQERREREEASRRELSPDAPPPRRPQPPVRRPVARDPRTANAPSASPTGRSSDPDKAPPRHPPVLERVFEVLVEHATGQKVERSERTLRPARRPPPPPAAPDQSDRESAPRRRKVAPTGSQRTQGVPAKSSIWQREDASQRKPYAQPTGERERRWSDETVSQRLKSASQNVATEPDETSVSSLDVHDALDNSESLRRAIVLVEILAPPISLRKDADEFGLP